MSKPIINGIDVSECGFCCWKHNGNKLIENYCALFNNKCICNPDCYFKQFKRLQEENEELKQVRKNYPDIQEPYVHLYRQIKKQCHKLQKENEELKEKVNSYNCNANCYKYKEADKYRQALEEIRANIQKWINSPWFCFNCRNNMDERLTEIKNKINEVLNEKP